MLGRKTYLSVVIPCYNEEEKLEKGVLEEVNKYLLNQKFSWEVIVVNDGSTDSSLLLLEDFINKNKGFRLLKVAHVGKPAAIWEGVKKARGEVILFTDMDQSTPIQELEKLLIWYDLDFDVVVGSRGIRRQGFSILRKIGSFLFRIIRRSLILWKIVDTQCGFKSFRRDAAIEIFPLLLFFKQRRSIKGWKVSAFDVELLYLFKTKGYRIKEVKVEWENQSGVTGKFPEGFTKRYLLESFEMFLEVIRVILNRVGGRY